MAIKGTSSKNKPKTKKGGIVSGEVGNYEKHPFFVKKANDSKSFLERHGFPKALKKRSKGA